MSYYEIVLLAFALSVDAFVVSFSYGLNFGNNKKTASQLSLFTSGFQGLMPVIGYYLTNFIKVFIQPYASGIVFTIFLILGIKFIFEAFQQKKEKSLCINLVCLFLIGIATSIDAFSAGISLSLCGNLILKPAILIAFITFINSNIGFYIGNKITILPQKQLEITAGVLLILLGFSSLF